jgi:hypothetical protein
VAERSGGPNAQTIFSRPEWPHDAAEDAKNLPEWPQHVARLVGLLKPMRIAPEQSVARRQVEVLAV